MANGLIPAHALPEALGSWLDDPQRPLRQVLIDRGDLDDSTAGLVDALASKHLEIHGGVAWRSLLALAQAIQLRLDPSELSDPRLRAVLARFVDDRGDRDSSAQVGIPTGSCGRYEILRRHAKGGLGVVSLARDDELHREVALKEIRPDRADYPDYRARFLREAEVTGRLEHPGIVPVYGIGHHEDGRPYYVMRFIRGETLRDAIIRLHSPSPEGEGEDEGPEAERFDLHSLVGRFVDACHAVAYAHHRGVLHRDIKPGNIMLGPFGETLVVDWGLAKPFNAPASDEYHVEDGLRPESESGMTPTKVGSEVGTKGYMSPEQAAGRHLELEPTSDIYGLGATLYYLIAGRPPFEGAGKPEFLRRVREGDFPRPRKVKPSIPRALEASA